MKPRNLKECFDALDIIIIPDDQKLLTEWTEKEFMSKVHFGLGRWIRNNWELWAKGTVISLL